MAEIEKCCFIPYNNNADYMIISPDVAPVDSATYTCKDHLSQMRCEGEPAFDLATGKEIEQ